MSTGIGVLVTRAGVRFAAAYEFVGEEGDQRAGILHCRTATADPAIFFEQLELHCEDGLILKLAITHANDEILGFVGQVLNAEPDPAD